MKFSNLMFADLYFEFMAAMLDNIQGHPTWLRHAFYTKHSEILFANNSAKKRIFLLQKLSQS